VTDAPIGIVDYGLGNLRSVAGAVVHLGYEPHVTADAEELGRCNKLILPGVGAFGDGMRKLRERGLVEVLHQLVHGERRPVLGVCLGAQLLARDSEEFGRHEGLGWIDASVRRLTPGDGLRVPHVGWNEVHQRGQSSLFDGIDDGALFYFVHSYRIEADDPAIVKGETPYGVPVTAVIEQGNVYGAQFHPEKSQLAGLKLLDNFLGRG
jgi:imidazole glycerol-phosphate synthase subunit HisH